MNHNSNNSTLILIFTCLLPFGIYYNLASSLNVQQTFIVNRISGSFITGNKESNVIRGIINDGTNDLEVIQGHFFETWNRFKREMPLGVWPSRNSFQNWICFKLTSVWLREVIRGRCIWLISSHWSSPFRATRSHTLNHDFAFLVFSLVSVRDSDRMAIESQIITTINCLNFSSNFKWYW